MRPAILNPEVWKDIFAGPLRLVLVCEREDGTELYRTYPLGSNANVYRGQTVSMQFEVGLRLNDEGFDPEASAGQLAYEEWASGIPGYDTWYDLDRTQMARWERVGQAAKGAGRSES